MLFYYSLHLPHHLSFTHFQMYFNIYFTSWHYFFSEFRLSLIPYMQKLPYRSFMTPVRQSLYFSYNRSHALRATPLSRITSRNLYHYVWKHWFYYGLTYLFLYFFNFAPILHELFCYIATFIFFISSDIWSSVTCTYKSIVTWIDECPSIFCNVFGCTPFSIHLVAKVCLNECI